MIGSPPQMPASESAAVDRIPVTLLTGFLGAGKTTVLNHLVKQAAMNGAAVLINEFGEVGIDHHLVEPLNNTMLLLESGCLCCAVQGDLVQALRDLSERSARREIPVITRVLIETTGLADPVPVIQTLMEERFVSARYVCDGVVTVVDATHAIKQIAQHPEAMRQVAMADRLLISKCDLVGAGTLAEVQARLRALNPAASRVEVRRGSVEAGRIFGGGIYASRRNVDIAAWVGGDALNIEATQRFFELESQTAHVVGPRANVSKPGPHDGRTSSFVIDFECPVAWYGFAVALGQVLQLHGASILRIKGLINAEGETRPLVVHCVQQVAYPVVHLDQWPLQSLFADRRGRLVLIVRDMTIETQQSIRTALLVPPAEAAARRISASNPVLSTRCWLNLQMPGGSSVIEHEAWTIQKLRPRKASD